MKRIDHLLPLLGKHHSGTLRHCQSVAMHMFEWAACMDFSDKEMHKAFVCGMVHDIGKFCVSRDILNKTEPLSERQQVIIQFHPVYGESILKAMGFAEISPVIRYHHERYDGEGYMEGLKEAEIPFLSRMIAVCDVFDEITNRREQNWNMDSQQALLEIERRAGAQLDPWLCEQFTEYIHKIEKIYAGYLI
jgi:polar amino acid transport system substrate-binding protein